MKWSGIIIVLALAMMGCKTEKTLIATASDIKTERSLEYGKDSIVIRDSVYVFVRGDTVFRDRVHTKYKERVVARVDTVYSTNTVVEEKIVLKENRLKVTGYRLLAIILACCCVVLFICWIFNIRR